jgi:allophanate hydrolase subunit 2
VVTLGQPVTGVRSIVAVRGGIEGPRVLGSLATDTLAGLGPQRIASGSLLSVGDARGDINVDHVPTSNQPSSITLRLHPGPRYEWLTASARTLLAEGVFTVGVDSDRIGVRLDGPRLDLREARPLASEGVVRGAVQVPPDGRPVVLGPDHPVTGGYPVVAVVEQVDALAQAAPGVPVRFTLVGW